ncbi:MAG: class I SAM-dependent methyltransferase [Rhizobiales bacterium]|nr:class I SAM-dependent methyltransferase [Hyphomicrobiales bacterium]
MSDSAATRTYVLGHSEAELARLERQAEIFAEPTEDVLRRAGISPGMRILDIGCGAGDVSMIAARLVGSSGEVVGIDRAGEALESARRRAAGAGYDWLRFEAADLHAFRSDRPFDAVIGRFILMYLTDAPGSIRELIGRLKPGGIVAFIEMDVNSAGAEPGMPLLDQCVAWITGTYRKVGIEPNMGSRLYATMRAANLEPSLVGSCRIEGGADAVGYEFAAQTLRSLLPWMTQFGIAGAEEVGVDTMAERLRSAALTGGNCIFLPRIVGAWARIGP